MRHLLSFVIALLLFPSFVSAQGRAPIHVQIVLDSSGSMATNDPKQLSKFAGMIFTDLAGPDDQIGVLSMQKEKFVVQPIASVAAKRKQNRDAIASLPFAGATHCSEPLTLAGVGLSRIRTATSKQFVIFLSDGACPKNLQTGSSEITDAADALKQDGVKVFSIGLFEDPAADTSDLQTMAQRTGGEFFSVRRASDLPTTFAKILGRIVGSQAQPVILKPDKTREVVIDGYAYDASLILTGSRRQTSVTRAVAPDGKTITIEAKSRPFVAESKDYFLSSQKNRTQHHYAVFRLNEPASGAWKITATGPSDLSAILIQNYALDPVVELDHDGVFAVGSEAAVRVVLHDKLGKPITDDAFLQKVEFTVTMRSPSQKPSTVSTKPNGQGVETKVTLDEEGKYLFTARVTMKEGGLNKTSAPRAVVVEGVTLVLKDVGVPIDLGSVKAGESATHTLDFSKSDVPFETKVSLSLDALSDVTVEPNGIVIGEKTSEATIRFDVSPSHAGGSRQGKLTVTSGEQSFDFPVVVEVIPLSFWERFGKLILTIGLGLLILLVLIFVVYGFTSPHSFGSDARLNWGETSKRLQKNEVVIREIPGSGRGFYRNAKLVVGGSTSFLPADGAELVTLEATGANQITISAAENVELLAVNKFDEKKTKPVDGNSCFMNAGELYRVGKLYVRLQ